MRATYGSPTMTQASTIRFGDKVFPELDGQALPVGIVADILDCGSKLRFTLEDGREFELGLYDRVFSAQKY
jgi:hypothetical protein